MRFLKVAPTLENGLELDVCGLIKTDFVALDVQDLVHDIIVKIVVAEVAVVEVALFLSRQGLEQPNHHQENGHGIVKLEESVGIYFFKVHLQLFDSTISDFRVVTS